MRGRDHRRALRQRLEQHQSLRFGARGEHEHIGGRIAVEQPGVAIEIADEMHVLGRAPSAADELPQRARAPGLRRRSRTSRPGIARAQRDEGLQQEFDVLLVRHAPDVQHQRPIGGQAERGAKARAVARREAVRRQGPVGMTWIGVVHAVAEQHARIGSEGAISALSCAHCERVKARASARPSTRGSSGT